MQSGQPSTLDAHVRAEARPSNRQQLAPSEIRITGPGKTRSYIAYATGLLTQKGHTAVVLKAMGQAINKTVTIAEIIKRRILGLHQLNEIFSIAVQDTWEPVEEGLDSLSVTRHVSVISITLSILPLNHNSPGYQPPLPPEMVKTHLPASQLMEHTAAMPAGGGDGKSGAFAHVADGYSSPYQLDGLQQQKSQQLDGLQQQKSHQLDILQQQKSHQLDGLQQQQHLDGYTSMVGADGQYAVHFDGRTQQRHSTIQRAGRMRGDGNQRHAL